MAIRIRTIDGITVALCAAETDQREGDIYLDDSVHYALTTKFMDDWGLAGDERLVSVMKTEKVRDAKEELERWLACK